KYLPHTQTTNKRSGCGTETAPRSRLAAYADHCMDRTGRIRAPPLPRRRLPCGRYEEGRAL
ncbi:hypothetical protein NDU88_004139, partial [Pleurodeles waltl]